MSSIIVGLVWQLSGSDKFKATDKLVALEFAEHAWDDGTNTYPSIEYVANRTLLDERSVQRHVRNLEDIGLLIQTGRGQRGTNKYKFPVSSRKDGTKFLNIKWGCQSVTLTKTANAGVTPASPEGLSPEGLSPELKVVVKTLINHQEEGPKFDFSEKLMTELQNAGIYQACWADIQNILDNGWDELDVKAVLSWQKSINRDKEKIAKRFVYCIREKNKAPDNYYEPRYEPTDDVDDMLPDDLDDAAPDGSAQDVWRLLLGQLKDQLPRNIFESAEKAKAQFDGSDTLVIQTRENSQWMADRLTRLAERALVGICNQNITVQFEAA